MSVPAVRLRKPASMALPRSPRERLWRFRRSFCAGVSGPRDFLSESSPVAASLGALAFFGFSMPTVLAFFSFGAFLGLLGLLGLRHARGWGVL